MKKKLLRNAGLVALSAVLVGSAAVAFTACGPGASGADDYTLDVYIFCSAADQVTNQTICNNWAAKYSEDHSEELGGNTITVNLVTDPNQTNYFGELENQIGTGDYADVIYLSPKSVVSYAQQGTRDLVSTYVESDSTLTEQLQGIWPKSLAFYATYGSAFARRNATNISYNSETGHFVDTTSGQDVSIYGLPKDYSNFGLGVNQNYFTDTMKTAYMTLKASTVRDVQTRRLSQSSWVQGTFSHTGGAAAGSAITYAATGTYTYTLSDGSTVEIDAVEGEEAPFVAIGVPVTYKPFNYYLYPTYDDALNGGDSHGDQRGALHGRRRLHGRYPRLPRRYVRDQRGYGKRIQCGCGLRCGHRSHRPYLDGVQRTQLGLLVHAELLCMERKESRYGSRSRQVHRKQLCGLAQRSGRLLHRRRLGQQQRSGDGGLLQLLRRRTVRAVLLRCETATSTLGCIPTTHPISIRPTPSLSTSPRAAP